MKFYCPFAKTECRSDCIFYGGYLDENDKDNCELYDGINTIRSLAAPNSYLDTRIDEIHSQLRNIEYNTSSDQTDSSEILDKLNDIKEFLMKKY